MTDHVPPAGVPVSDLDSPTHKPAFEDVIVTVGFGLTIISYSLVCGIHGAPKGLFVVTVIVLVCPISETFGVYVKEKGLVLVDVGVNVPKPLCVKVTLVADPPKTFPVTVIGVVLHVCELVPFNVNVG